MAEHDIYLVREKSDGSFAEISGYTHKTTSAQITNAAYDALAATDPGDGSVWQGSYTSNMPMSYSGTGTLTFNTALKVPELLVEGDTTIVHTNTTTSERLSITNDGTGPALFINQIGSQPILDIQDDGYAALFIKDGGDVGIGKNDPGTKLDVNGIVTWTGGNSTNANLAYGWGDHNAAGYATGNQTITLTGDASGAGETSIAVVVADDSHNHTGSSGDFTVGGNLTVNGTTTTINSTTLEVEDLNITVAKGAADAAAADGAGLTVDGGGATLLYSNDAWSFNKNVGIGNANPDSTLSIFRIDQHETDSALEVHRGDASPGHRPTAPILNVFNGQGGKAEVFRVQGDGNVGIGTDQPLNKLHVRGLTPADGFNGSSTAMLAIESEEMQPGGTDRSRLNFGLLPYGGLDGAQEGNAYIQARTADLLLQPANGKVGIGTSNPRARLSLPTNGGDHTGATNQNTIASSADGISLGDDANSYGFNLWHDHAGISGGSPGQTVTYLDSVYDNDDSLITFRTKTAGTAVDALTIKGDGDVGIGTTNPGASLDIVNTNNMTLKGNGLSVQGGANSGSEGYSFRALDMDGNTDFFVRGDGNVGIGTDPDQRLHVKGGHFRLEDGQAWLSRNHISPALFAKQEGVGPVAVLEARDKALPSADISLDGSVALRLKATDDNAVTDFGTFGGGGTWIQARNQATDSMPYDLLLNPFNPAPELTASIGNVGIGTMNAIAALDMGPGDLGRSIGWGGSEGNAHNASVGTTHTSGDLYLGTGFKANNTGDWFKYSSGYDAWSPDESYYPGDNVIRSDEVYEQTHTAFTTGSGTDPSGPDGATYWTAVTSPANIGIAGMKFDRDLGITYFYNKDQEVLTKNTSFNTSGHVSMALYPDRVEIEGEEVLTTPEKYEYSATDTARQDDTHFYVDTDVSGVTIDGMYEVYATIDNTPEDGQRQIDVLYGKVIIGSGGSGGTKKRYVHYVRENPQPRDLYESNGITLNHDITPYLVFSGTAGSDVGAGDSAQLRLSFNSGAEKHATDIGNINWFKMKLRKTI